MTRTQDKHDDDKGFKGLDGVHEGSSGQGNAGLAGFSVRWGCHIGPKNWC